MTALDEMFGAAVVVTDAVDRARAAAVRTTLRYTRYGLVDRGSYDIASVGSELDDVAVRLAASATGRTLAVVERRVLRLVAGDYLLARHDRVYEGIPVEVMLDLSPASVPGAEVHYRRRGQVFFRYPCVPGTAAIVERGPTVTCNHTYVSKLHGDAFVVRWIAILR